MRANSSAQPWKGTARPPNAFASATALSCERFDTMMLRAPRERRAHAVFSLVSRFELAPRLEKPALVWRQRVAPEPPPAGSAPPPVEPRPGAKRRELQTRLRREKVV